MTMEKEGVMSLSGWGLDFTEEKGGTMAPGREQEEEGLSKPYLISTPAGNKYIISARVFQGIMWGKTTKLVGVPDLQFIFARKIGETKARFHYLPVAVSDISRYFEVVSDIEPVGCATVEESSFEKPPFEVSGY